ncbi:napD family protein [Paraburkholderia fungorum]|jgi:nitrate reductase NapD|uniref:Chaperone NapD n=1 Tax=Paraburkholderia fungorum TaxID=134537 RepID=A0AAU8T9I0_9BURK|nr:chaperone NapD [Paraburkholderia fungorum]KFX65051.1 glutamate synthase [Burkholderia sp. K24]AJZ63213.1 napD family protein [Paraburkholderia fungorum]USU20713.1 chaperone NapD [Paraburkholderia fungorum]USU27290.1 chaperone NapD [Paraburkholderia fungorum]USX06114.1 chaperone NapD [Paraburkholderia fungorum]
MSVVSAEAVCANEARAELHIAGIVVHVQATRLDSVCRAIAEIPKAEIHAVSEQGKLVVTLEGAHTAEVAAQLSAIHALPGVYGAALVYQHHEDIESLDEEVADEAHPSHVY